MACENQPKCFGRFLSYPAVLCMECRVWRECSNATAANAEKFHSHEKNEGNFTATKSREKQFINLKLEMELKRLKAMLDVEESLQVHWIPDPGRDVDGEVRDGIIYVYAEDEDQAIEVLRHELMDYLLTSRLVKPLVDLINLLIKHRESEIYREKESLVKVFCRLLEAAEA